MLLHGVWYTNTMPLPLPLPTYAGVKAFTLPSPQELYDALMQQIEPDLVSTMLKVSNTQRAGESAAAFAQRTLQYKAAFGEYKQQLQTWVHQVQTIFKQVQQSVRTQKEQAELQDRNAQLQALENLF